MEALKQPLLELTEYQKARQELRDGQGPVALSGCVDAAKAHLISGLCPEPGMKLLVTYSDLRAKELYEDLKSFFPQVYWYPSRDLLFYSADVHGNAITKQRLCVVRALLEGQGGIVVTTIDGCMDPLVPLKELSERMLFLEAGARADIEELRKKLSELGYEAAALASEPGQFSVRGGILDIFPLTEDCPFRLEFWGDEIDSIRSFDAESQRSIENLQHIWIYPATELSLTGEEKEKGLKAIEKEAARYGAALRKQMRTEEAHRMENNIKSLVEGLREGWLCAGLESYIRYFKKETVSFTDYFPEDAFFFLDEPARLSEKAEAVLAEFRESMMGRLEKGYLLPGQTELLYEPEAVFHRLSRKRALLLSGLDIRTDAIKARSRYHMDVRSMASYQSHFEELVKDLTRWRQKRYRVVLLSASRTRAARLAKDLQEYDLLTRYGETGGEEALPGQILVLSGSLKSGFEYPLLHFCVVTEGDMFGREKRKKRRKHTEYKGQKIQSFTELSIGDYVVHENHGLGIYRGIEKVEVGGVTKDYLKIEYGNNANLYTPVTQMDLVQKYAAAGAKTPKLNRLGGGEWKKTKSRVKGAVKEIAADLVKLYAARQERKGYAYGQDTVWQREFEELFPFEETEDQKRAIEETKADMESAKIMDRLICGDVGYGKTEVAIRAAFKAVQESKQVVFLVPTTILAQQHYNTFVQRMKDYPVTVALLSRFNSPSQQKKILEDLKKGFVDIVIGTHRVLSKDVAFKDLGLLVIDEEQRFGVAHKEKIKKLKENVDVLTLTATPIPRTLHMSLSGIRDMSVLEEPPMDRVPIQTYVMEYNEELVREAVRREMGRGGQVYYVYNRVKDIEDMTAKLQSLIPEAHVVYAHGQMRERELERIMFDFINGDIDVLVSTTIIETGLDISNVNTIIIHDADRFGLSQLYQLRGRVGRSNRTAYAFLMYQQNKLLREVAEKRLAAIREYTELGSGIRIAMRDLEIRGAGNLLGAEQHGHMEAVGYDLYCKLLNTAVRMLKGEETPFDGFETTVDLTMDAYIPSSYIRNEALKLEVYKRISAIETEEEYEDMQDELLDRFGDLPRAVENLLKASVLRSLAHSADVQEVTGNRQEVRLLLYQKARISVEEIPKLLVSYGGSLKFSPRGEPFFTLYGPKKGFSDSSEMLESVKKLLNDIKMLIVS